MDNALSLLTRTNAREMLAAFKLDRLGCLQPSAELLALPIVVSGAISRTALQHPLATRFADPKERQWAAATLQVLCRCLRDTRTRETIGKPISAQAPLRPALDAAMTSLLERVLAHEYTMNNASSASSVLPPLSSVGTKDVRGESAINRLDGSECHATATGHANT